MGTMTTPGGRVRRWGWRALLAATTALTSALPLAGSAPAAAQAAPPKVLVNYEIAGFDHGAARTEGAQLLGTALTDAGFDVVLSEDTTEHFTPAGLAEFDALVMFQNSEDIWTADEKAAMEGYMQAGGGIVAVHNSTDLRADYDWWDTMIGATMPGHSAQNLEATLVVEDQTHPSTAHLDEEWVRNEEWYNFVYYPTGVKLRGNAHVLLTVDENTYEPGGNAMGYDHPISWCKNYDGGRAFMTALGHDIAYWQTESMLMQHVIGGIEWAAGTAEGDCSGTDWSTFERVTLDSNTSAPFAMDVAGDGRVFFTELVRGQIRVYDPATLSTATALEIDVYSGGEDGLLGIALDPDFDTNGHVFVYHSPASADDSDPANWFNRLSRFTMGPDGQFDPASERVILEVPAGRGTDEPGHTGGGLRFGPDGSLYLSVGDDVNPHSEPSGGYAPLSEEGPNLWDARATSSSTNDLRGKLLRILPTESGATTYTIPDGNLVDSEWAAGLTAADRELIRPEIYAMGFRNPFRFTIDPVTGHIGLADYSPDNNNDDPANRGPAGISEWNYITEPGNYGWPLCMGDNEPFRDVDYGQGDTSNDPPIVGDYFDCANPINDSIHNTGLAELPPVQPADVFYGYQRASDQGSGLNQGGGLAPMGGPFYSFDAALESDTKFPEYYDGKPFFYEWARNRMFSFLVTDDAEAGTAAPGDAVRKVNPFMEGTSFQAPIDSLFGPEGAMYVLDWGGGFGRHNPDSGLHRIDYISGSRSPIAEFTADPDSGTTPLTVDFDASASSDPENEALTFEWDFDDDGTVDATGVTASHTYDTNGVYDARLIVIDPHGKTGTTTIPITVGNTRPVVEVTSPPTGAFFDFGANVDWTVSATDAEDDPVDPADVIVQPALGHDAHAHPTTEQHGTSGTSETSLGGHAPDENIFFAIDARYSDAGANGQPSLTGSDTNTVYPRLRQAEFFTDRSGVTTGSAGDIVGDTDAIAGADGAWAAYDPVNLYGVDSLTLRVASNAEGSIELRRDAPDGELLGTAAVPDTGGLARYTDVNVDVTDPGDTFTLYVVFPGAGVRQLNFIEAVGQAASATAPTDVAITSPAPWSVIDDPQLPETVTITADASDVDSTVTQVEFFVDDVSIGVDTEAPYSADFVAEQQGRYIARAVATADDGLTSEARAIAFDVGDLFAGWATFSHPNADATFERPDTESWTITSSGANTWQATDEYGSAFMPGAADTEQWTATVRVDDITEADPNGKAGIMVRNAMTEPGVSGGYIFFGKHPTQDSELLHDSDGNGTLDTSARGGGSGYPTWLRLVRDGDVYRAYSSPDGENFTQVGGDIAPGNAAAVQDIGLSVTAHQAGGYSTATFTGWSLVDEVVDPDPGPDVAPLPVCAVGSRDEFDGDALDTAVWTTVREAEGLPITVADGAAHLPVTAGDINEAGAGPISYIGRDVPSGEAWTFTTEVTAPIARQWQHAGLMLHQSDDEYVKLAFTHNGGNPFLEFQSETGGGRTWHGGSVDATGMAGQPLQLRLTSDGTAVTGEYSFDQGATWAAFAETAPLKADATVGIVAAGDTGTPDVSAAVGWAELATASDSVPEVAPSDEFDGDALDGCRWNRSVRGNANDLEVADGHLKVTTRPGDINGTANEDPQNLILQDAPDGDWVLETRLRADFTKQWQFAGLLAYADDDNYIKHVVGARNADGSPLNLAAEHVSEIDANFGAGGNTVVDIAETAESGYFYLRLTKQGDQYTAEVSDGGINWTQVGEPSTHPGPLDSVGLIAVGPEQIAPATVEFDDFRLNDAAPIDETAPTVDANLLGTFTGTVTAASGESVAGTTSMTIDEFSTSVSATYTGLAPNTVYAAHLHDGVCQMGSGHYRDDPDGAEAPPNELWLTQPGRDDNMFVTDSNGEATASASADWVARSTAGSVMVHNGDGAGLMIGCAPLNASDGEVDVQVNASDNIGVESVEYRLGDGEWAAYDGPVTVADPGEHSVEYRAADAAGNVSEVGSAGFTIREPLTIELTADPATADGDNGWYTSPVTVSAVTSGDPDRVEFSVDGGEWFTDDDLSIELDEGAHDVTARATRVTAVETATVAIGIDATAPAVSVDGIGGKRPIGRNGTIVVSADDAVSGVASLSVSIDGVEVGTSSPIEIAGSSLAPGPHTLTATAVDTAGHATTVEVDFRSSRGRS